MGRKYNIIERLKAKNERPFVVLDEDHTYTIDTSKTTVMGIMALVDEIDKKEESIERDMEMNNKIIKMTLGKDASEYIESQNYTMSAYMEIITTIMAAINNSDLEDEENQPKKQ